MNQDPLMRDRWSCPPMHLFMVAEVVGSLPLRTTFFTPTTFTIFPPDDQDQQSTSKYLRRAITDRGGDLVAYDRKDEDPYTITILNAFYFTKHPDANFDIPNDVFASDFIWDIVQAEEGDVVNVDLNDYLFTDTAYKNYNANDILSRRTSWAELTVLDVSPPLMSFKENMSANSSVSLPASSSEADVTMRDEEESGTLSENSIIEQSRGADKDSALSLSPVVDVIRTPPKNTINDSVTYSTSPRRSPRKALNVNEINDNSPDTSTKSKLKKGSTQDSQSGCKTKTKDAFSQMAQNNNNASTTRGTTTELEQIITDDNSTTPPGVHQYTTRNNRSSEVLLNQIQTKAPDDQLITNQNSTKPRRLSPRRTCNLEKEVIPDPGDNSITQKELPGSTRENEPHEVSSSRRPTIQTKNTALPITTDYKKSPRNRQSPHRRAVEFQQTVQKDNQTAPIVHHRCTWRKNKSPEISPVHGSGMDVDYFEATPACSQTNTHEKSKNSGTKSHQATKSFSRRFVADTSSEDEMEDYPEPLNNIGKSKHSQANSRKSVSARKSTSVNRQFSSSEDVEEYTDARTRYSNRKSKHSRTNSRKSESPRTSKSVSRPIFISTSEDETEDCTGTSGNTNIDNNGRAKRIVMDSQPVIAGPRLNAHGEVVRTTTKQSNRRLPIAGTWIEPSAEVGAIIPESASPSSSVANSENSDLDVYSISGDSASGSRNGEEESNRKRNSKGAEINKVTSSHQMRRAPIIRCAGGKYTPIRVHEGQAILDLILKENWLLEASGNTIWQFIEKKNLLQKKLSLSRTWQTLRNHWMKIIVRDLTQPGGPTKFKISPDDLDRHKKSLVKRAEHTLRGVKTGRGRRP